MTLSLITPFNKANNLNSSRLTLFKLNMAQLLTKQVTTCKIFFKNIGEKRKSMRLNFSNNHFQYIHPSNIHFSLIHLLVEKIWKKMKNNMEDHYITGLLDSNKPLSKLSMIFNISKCASVDIWIQKQNLTFLLSNMACNTSYTIHMKL